MPRSMEGPAAEMSPRANSRVAGCPATRSDAVQEFANGKVHAVRDFGEIRERDRLLASLHITHKAAIHAKLMGKLELRESSTQP